MSAAATVGGREGGKEVRREAGREGEREGWGYKEEHQKEDFDFHKMVWVISAFTNDRHSSSSSRRRVLTSE